MNLVDNREIILTHAENATLKFEDIGNVII